MTHSATTDTPPSDSPVSPQRFGIAARILHWLMAILIVSMIVIGAALLGGLGHYATLLSIHKTIGLIILVLAVIRIGNRLIHRPPPQLDTLSRPERFVSIASEGLMYLLFVAQPLIGWAMVSASGIPIKTIGGLYIPSILPVDAGVYATLRSVHTVLAYALLAAFIAHMSAVLFHALVLRDGLLRRMTFTRA